MYFKKTWRNQGANYPRGIEVDWISACLGQVSSPKKNHAAELRVIFGLMPALLFYQFC